MSGGNGSVPLMKPGILGVGAAVPDNVMTNHDLEKLVDTSDEWITSRTGIKERRILRENEDPVDLAIEASKKAIEDAGITPQDIDFVITATNLGAMPIPGSSPFIINGLDIGKDIPFFDLLAGCTGFVYALKVASDMLKAGSYKNILIVGLEGLSRFTDWEDRATCVLFGDGAGAAVVSEMPEGRGVISSCISGDSSKWDVLYMDGGGIKNPANEDTLNSKMHLLKMTGGGVFKSAVRMMEETTLKALDQASLKLEDVDWIVPHQANMRILKAFAERIEFPLDKVVINLDKYGNTSTASIPLALVEAIGDGRIKKGDLLVLNAFGAGVTYGAIALRW
jgi:3-oxoacyl-[acyl-carrier-protein] synthase-3